MVKTIKLALLLATLLGATAGSAWAAPPGGHGGAGFSHGGAGIARGGPGVVRGHGGFRGGFRGHGEFRGGTRGSIFIGGPLFWPPFYDPWPYYYPYYYGAPVVVVPPAPSTYIEQGTPDQYWYFCSNPQGYYPYVKECPSGWQAVTPQPADAD